MWKEVTEGEEIGYNLIVIVVYDSVVEPKVWEHGGVLG
jgi:hypothetical protein